MKASETKLLKMLEGTQQYVVPLFQRAYKWDKREWEDLWSDLMELYEEPNEERTHFIGSIVTMPTISVPEGVSKFMLIDGQQRLTTIFILLALIRDRARLSKDSSILSDKINELYLTNKFSEGGDFYKLLPTQVDREAFQAVIKGDISTDTADQQILKAYNYFNKKVGKEINLNLLEKVITTRLLVVSIVLEKDDNPYLVFESLNAKGQALEQSDLIRNHFFMRINPNQQQEVYEHLWLPMQTALDNKLTDFIRHYLMKDGASVRQDDIYMALKKQARDRQGEEIISYLRDIVRFSGYYDRLLHPARENNAQISRGLQRLNRFDVTTAYPFLLNCYSAYDQGQLPAEQLIEIIKVIENFVVRRFICGIPTNQLNKIFPILYIQAKEQGDDLLSGTKAVLQGRNYPKDDEFMKRIEDIPLYGGGDRAVKAKLILESIEEWYEHKEQVAFDDLSIEHIMPQTLSDWWFDYLGENAEVIHELYQHTIGNLTLTAYNTELYNNPFPEKQNRLKDSHLEMNKYFSSCTEWKQKDIEERTKKLANILLGIWPYFGSYGTGDALRSTVTGSHPFRLTILGETYVVNSWRDVEETTLNTILDLDPEQFENLATSYPHFLNKDCNRFHSTRKLKNGFYIEVNRSANVIQRFCKRIVSEVGLSEEDWKVEIAN